MKEIKKIGGCSVRDTFVVATGYIGLLVTLEASPALPTQSEVIHSIRDLTRTAERHQDVVPLPLPPNQKTAASNAILNIFMDVSDCGVEFVEPGIMPSLKDSIEKIARTKNGYRFKCAIPARKSVHRKHYCRLNVFGNKFELVEYDPKTLFIEPGESVLVIVKKKTKNKSEVAA